jgi:hypothetical protein
MSFYISPSIPGPPGEDGNGTAYYGQIGRQSTGTVSVATSDIYYPIDLPGTFDAANSYGLTEGTGEDLALKNDTGTAQLLTVIGSADVRSSNNQVLGLRLAVNGVTIPASECRVTTGSTNYGKLLSQWIIELDDGDEVSMHVANHGHTTNITVDRAKLVAFTTGRQGEPGPGTDITYDSATREVRSSSGEDATLPLVATNVAGLQPATSFSAITYAATVTLNLASLTGQYRTITLTGNLELVSSNPATGRTLILRLINGATLRTLTFPADWRFVTAKPVNIAASKVAVLRLTSYGTINADIVAEYTVEP